MSAGRPGTGVGKRTVDRVYEEIRRSILSGRLTPGERITEDWLAERFGASRTPVRAAILKLAGDGFVEMTPRSGTMVKRRSAQEIADIFDVRALLESAAAGLAATRCDAVDLSQIRALQREMEEVAGAVADQARGVDPGGNPIAPDQVERLSVLNKAFHQRILEAAGNVTLTDSAERLMDIGFLTNTYLRFSAVEIVRSLSEHRNLVAALTSRDADWAEAVMRAHILGARNALQEMAPT